MILGFIICIPIGVVFVIGYYYFSDLLYRMKVDKEPREVCVSSELNRPGIRIPVNSLNDKIVWVEDNNQS